LHWSYLADRSLLPAIDDLIPPQVGAYFCSGPFERGADGRLAECNLVFELEDGSDGTGEHSCDEFVGAIVDDEYPSRDGGPRCIIRQVSALPYQRGENGAESGWYFDDFSPRAHYWGCTPEETVRGWGLVNLTDDYRESDGVERLLNVRSATLECYFKRCAGADAGARD